MDMYLQMSIWTFQPQIWVIVGLVFILLEMTDGSAIFFLPMGLKRTNRRFMDLLI